MSADREMDHLMNMAGMHDSRYSPGQYAVTESQEREEEDRLRETLAAAHSQLFVTTRDFLKPAPYQSEPGLEESDETTSL